MDTNEREQVEWVFGLTGGELSDKPLKFKAPGRYGDIQDRSWRYHYDGVPEWAGSDFNLHDYYSAGYFTLVEWGISYESNAPKELTTPDGKLYLRVATYSHSGESECPMGSCGNDETVGEDSTEGLQMCSLCEEKQGEKHGYIYLGNGAEHVYRHVDPECAVCGVQQSECLAADLVCACE